MNNKEMGNIRGGFTFTSTLLNAITKAASTLYDFGRRLSSSILRSQTNNYCPME